MPKPLSSAPPAAPTVSTLPPPAAVHSLRATSSRPASPLPQADDWVDLTSRSQTPLPEAQVTWPCDGQAGGPSGSPARTLSSHRSILTDTTRLEPKDAARRDVLCINIILREAKKVLAEVNGPALRDYYGKLFGGQCPQLTPATRLTPEQLFELYQDFTQLRALPSALLRDPQILALALRLIGGEGCPRRPVQQALAQCRRRSAQFATLLAQRSRATGGEGFWREVLALHRLVGAIYEALSDPRVQEALEPPPSPRARARNMAWALAQSAQAGVQILHRAAVDALPVPTVPPQ